MTLPKMTIHFDEQSHDIFPTDLEHLAAAAKLLRANHQYTAADRVDAIRAFVAANLSDDDQ